MRARLSRITICGTAQSAALSCNPTRTQYQYIVFTPTAIDGLPDSATVGEPFDLTVTGDLQIRDITHPETFDVTVTPVSETELQITAKTTVQRADFGLQIPNVPRVANVEEDVELELDLVAVAQ